MHPLARTECHKIGLPTSMTLEETSIKKLRKSNNKYALWPGRVFKMQQNLMSPRLRKKMGTKAEEKNLLCFKSSTKYYNFPLLGQKQQIVKNTINKRYFWISIPQIWKKKQKKKTSQPPPTQTPNFWEKCLWQWSTSAIGIVWGLYCSTQSCSLAQ